MSSFCAICYENFDDHDVILACMPCNCEREEASTKFCVRCIELVCERSSFHNNIGRCPRCSTLIQVKDQRIIVAAEQPSIQCIMCQQLRFPSAERSDLCAPCFIGANNPLRYECDRCHRVQRIDHPMYRYQLTPNSFGTATWACHQGCMNYSKWRIIPQDVRRVPVEDAPDGWNLREQEFEVIREIRRAERREGSMCIIQ